MTGAEVGWILLSAVTHAVWNFLFKRAGGTPTFIGLSKISEAALLTPVFVYLFLPLPIAWGVFLWLSIGGAVFVLANYVFLTAAYAKGDLAFVYPISRGSILCFLPVLGYMLLAEHIDRVGAIALSCVTAGVLMMQLPSLTLAAIRDLVQHLRTPAALLALGAGFAGASSTLWDKQAIQQLPRLAYYYGYTTLTAIAYVTYLVRSPGTAGVRETWRMHRLTIITVGLCNTLSYMLVLVALKATTSSYVIGLRQLSIGIGAFLGYRYLREPITRARIVGVILLLLGCVLIPLAR